jgi:hypothetical protein
MVKAMAMSTPDRDFHVGRGLLHGVMGFAVFLVLAMAFVGTEPFGGSIGELTEAASKYAIWGFLLALLASYAFQTSRRTLGSLMLFVMVGLFVFQLFALTRIAHARRDDNSPLTQIEREQPSPGAAGRLCQPALAFSFPAPDRRFAPVAAKEGPGNLGDPYRTQWDWQDRRTGELLLVQVTKGAGRDEASLRSFAAGFKRSLVQGNPNVQLGPEDLRWTEPSGEFTLSFSRGEEQMDVRCLSRMAEDETPPILICVQTTVREGIDPLRQVRTGLSLAPCGAVAG